MECNKEEALQCLDLAKEGVQRGDGAKAKLFLQKAEKMLTTNNEKKGFLNCPKSGNNGGGFASNVLLPALLVLIACLTIIYFATPEPVYSFKKTRRYPIEKRTVNINVPYYVKESFDEERYEGSLMMLEAAVETEYLTNLHRMCHREKTQMDNLLWRARQDRSEAMMNKLASLKMDSCDEIKKLRP